MAGTCWRQYVPRIAWFIGSKGNLIHHLKAALDKVEREIEHVARKVDVEAAKLSDGVARWLGLL